MPTDVARWTNEVFKYTKDRNWKNVQGWIELMLSMGGKCVFIKSVLQAIPAFAMSCFKLPTRLGEHINSIIWSFWWGSKECKKKSHWVSWKTITKHKHDGGLGFRAMEIFNLALLVWQAWWLLTNPNTPSACILKAIYFPEGEILGACLGNRPSQI
jgi:hypothetical protein